MSAVPVNVRLYKIESFLWNPYIKEEGVFLEENKIQKSRF